jgi:tetratricopeptide (TPR) repeat protein
MQHKMVKRLVKVVELDEQQQGRLSYTILEFLGRVRPAVMYSWAVLEESPIDYEWHQTRGNLSTADINTAIEVCLNPQQIGALKGLAKFVALFYKSKRCPEGKQLDWLLEARTQAEQITTEADLEFSGGLFLWKIGIALFNLGQYEEAITSYDKAIEIQPDKYEAWYNRGVALSALGQQDAAIANYNIAIEIKPDYHKAHYKKACCYALQDNWEAAIASLQRAIELDASYREMAKTATDFDGIRDSEQFQSLIGS